MTSVCYPEKLHSFAVICFSFPLFVWCIFYPPAVFLFLCSLNETFLYLAGDLAMALEAKFSLLLKTMGLQKLGSGLINQFQMVMILEAFAKSITGSFVLVLLLF